MNGVALGEALDYFGSVLPGAPCDIVGDANVERAVSPAGENVDARLPVHGHFARPWMPAIAGMTNEYYEESEDADR
jgi:hypothetical protein